MAQIHIHPAGNSLRRSRPHSRRRGRARHQGPLGRVLHHHRPAVGGVHRRGQDRPLRLKPTSSTAPPDHFNTPEALYCPRCRVRRAYPTGRTEHAPPVVLVGSLQSVEPLSIDSRRTFAGGDELDKSFADIAQWQSSGTWAVARSTTIGEKIRSRLNIRVVGDVQLILPGDVSTCSSKQRIAITPPESCF